MSSSTEQVVLDWQYRTAGLACETLLFGFYALSVAVLSHTMITRRGRPLLLYLTMYMFAVTTINWGLSISDIIRAIKDQIMYSGISSVYASCGVFCVLGVFDAIVVLNYAFSDSLLVWRAWILCRGMGGMLCSLRIMIAALAITFLFTFAQLGVTISIVVVEFSHVHQHMAKETRLAFILHVCRVGTLVFSLLTNIMATSMILLKAWKYREFLFDIRPKGWPTPTGRIVALLVESGILYCISSILILISIFVPLSSGTLGNLYHPIHVQLSASASGHLFSDPPHPRNPKQILKRHGIL